MDSNRLKMIGAALAAIVVVVVGFLLGIEPQLQIASAARTSERMVAAQNLALEDNITELRSQNATIGDLKKQLTTLKESVPSDLDSAAFISEIDALAVSTGVTVTSYTTSSPVAYVSPVVATTPAPTTTGTTSTPSPSASATASPTPSATTPAAPAVVTNPLITGADFTDIPVSIEVDGTNLAALNFLKALRNGNRLLLVTGITASPSAEGSSTTSGASGKSSSTSMTWTISGLVYALTDAVAAQAEQAAASATTTDAAAGK